MNKRIGIVPEHRPIDVPPVFWSDEVRFVLLDLNDAKFVAKPFPELQTVQLGIQEIVGSQTVPLRERGNDRPTDRAAGGRISDATDIWQICKVRVNDARRRIGEAKRLQVVSHAGGTIHNADLFGGERVALLIGTRGIVDDVSHFREAGGLKAVLLPERLETRFDDQTCWPFWLEEGGDIDAGGVSHDFESWVNLAGSIQRSTSLPRDLGEIGSARAAASRWASSSYESEAGGQITTCPCAW